MSDVTVMYGRRRLLPIVAMLFSKGCVEESVHVGTSISSQKCQLYREVCKKRKKRFLFFGGPSEETSKNRGVLRL